MALLSQQFPIGNCYHHNICPETNSSNHYKEEKGGKTLMMMKGVLRIPLSSFQSFPFCSSSRGTSARVLLSATSASVAVSTSGASQDKIVGDIRWGWSCLQGLRSEMEDDVVVRSDSLNGFHFAAVFDGHAGFSSVRFLRDELYKECAEALQGGLLLKDRDFTSIKEAIQMAFANADSKLLGWLDQAQTDNDSGSTATVIFVGGDMLIISHVGDSCVVLSRAGKAETLNSPHRPYGNNRTSLEEIRRIREAGGWIVDGRICGDISVSRAFGDIRFKTRKIEMLERGVKKGRWTQKFISRIQINGDWVTSVPDIHQVSLCANSEFLLLASDGLWDYMNSSEAVRFVRNQLRQHGDVQAACDALARAALDRKSQDNISIVIADLGRTNWQTIPPEEDGQNFFIEIGQAFATISIVSMGIWLSYQFAP